MARAPSSSTLPSTYDDFLYAPVGESTNGTLLTVLSVLARQNIDPWEEAADLSRMPRDSAARRLISMITVSPGQSSIADQEAVADRLVALLPRRIAAVDRAPNVLQGEPAVRRYASAVNWLVIAIYIGVVVLSQWIAASFFEKPTAGVAPVPSPQSNARETPPSSEDK
jgi:hypothetical protein